MENEIISGVFIVALSLACVLLRILLHRSMKREDAAMVLAGETINKAIKGLKNKRPRPTRTYQALAEDNLDKISFFRRDTPTESTIYMGAKGWNLERCIQEGYIVYANTEGNKGSAEERRDTDDYLTAIVMDMLIRDFSIQMRLQEAGLQNTLIVNDQIVDSWEVENVPVDESLLYSSKKKEDGEAK